VTKETVILALKELQQDYIETDSHYYEVLEIAIKILEQK
jgi:hypothetical protein